MTKIMTSLILFVSFAIFLFSLVISCTSDNQQNGFSFMSKVKIDTDFQPHFNDKVIRKDEVNLTHEAKLIKIKPDYYKSDIEDLDKDYSIKTSSTTMKTATISPKTVQDNISDIRFGDKYEYKKIEETTKSSIITAAITIRNRKNKKKVLSVTNLITLDDDFKPLFKGKVIPRTELNLTDMAKKVLPEMDYYDDEGDEFSDKLVEVSKPASKYTTTTTTSSLSEDNEEGFLEKDIDLAVGGITGILEKLLHGPKENEINNRSKPEDIYIYLNGIIHDEMEKAAKATIPRIYDYQYFIGERVSQRCLNSFVKFAERWRKHYIWPIKMIAASSSFLLNKFALRYYGDFDSCLNIVADDEDHRKIYFTGQYCMVQIHLPLPILNQSITYGDKIMNFNETEIHGTFSEYFLLNAPFLYSNPFSFGVCLPSSCSPKEMEDVANFFLQKLHIKAHFTSDCYSRLNMTVESLPGDVFEMNLTSIEELNKFSILHFVSQLTKSQMLAVIYLIISVSIVGLATTYEIYYQYVSENQWKSTERDRPKSFFACFSLRYNLEQIFLVLDRYRENEAAFFVNQQVHQHQNNNNGFDNYIEKPRLVDTSCLDAIKTIALAWICLANFYFLGYQPQMLSSLTHLRELVLSLRTNFSYQIVIQSWLSYEVFFLISGFLLAYTSLPFISLNDNRPQLSFFFLKRVIRLLPSMIFVLLIINLLPLWTNAGPLYNSSVEKILQPCGNYYWRSLFFLANFYEYNQTCLPYLWYICNEFQLFILGIIVLIFVYDRSEHAMKVFGLFILIGIIMSGLTTHRLELNFSTLIFENAILEEIPAVIKALHFNTIVHFSSYFAGMALGYHIRKNQGSKLFNFPLPIQIMITLFSLFLSLSFVIYTPVALSQLSSTLSTKYGKIFAVIYYILSRIIFIGSSLWIISQCLPRKNIITKMLSWSIFRICSHFSYQIYLLNFIVIWTYMFTKRTFLETNFMESFPVAMSLFIMTCVISLFTHLILEAPYRNLYRYYFESPRIVRCSTMLLSGNRDYNERNRGTTFSKEMDSNPSFLQCIKISPIPEVISIRNMPNNSINKPIKNISAAKDNFKDSNKNSNHSERIMMAL